MMNLSATYKGVITGSLMILVSVFAFYSLKLPENGDTQIAVIVIFIAGIIWSLVSFKQRVSQDTTFKDYFSEGFKTFIVVALFMAIFTFIFYRLNPQILENTIKENNILVMQQGDHTPAEIDENANKLRDIFMPMMLATKTIMFLFTGAVVTLIATLILKPGKSQ